LKASFELGNGGLNLSNHLKRFRAFPYDSTRVDVMVQFRSQANANEPNSTGLDLQFNRQNVSTRLKDGTHQHVDWLATRHCDDLALKGFGYALGSNPVDLWGQAAGTRPCLCLSLHIARTPTFYEQKSILPLYAVLIFGLLCYYALEPTDLANRISIMAALFLTARRRVRHFASTPSTFITTGLRDSVDRDRAAAAPSLQYDPRHGRAVCPRGTDDAARRRLRIL